VVNAVGALAEAESRELLETLDAGFALPSSWYTDERLFARERERVLLRGWHYGSHTGVLSRSGDQALADIAGVPVVLVRDDDEIRGFVNVCRHQAHPVVLEEGNRQLLECSYDGWTYDAQGRLAGIPDAAAEALDLAELGLIPVQTAVWGPAVWVNVDFSAPPFFEWIEGLPELVASHGVDVDSHALAFEDTWSISANWKVFLDNAIECYHCPTCHPALSQVLEMDPALHELTVGSRFRISHKVPLRQSAVGTAVAMPSSADQGDRIYYHFHWIFPTTYFQYAGAGFDIGAIGVRGVDEILFRHLTFLPIGMSEAEVAERRQRLDVDPTVSEDVAICERVQQAHTADFAPPGRLLPGSEWLLQHFQRVIVELMAEPR
jgi:carnitine monooxygenase subunit